MDAGGNNRYELLFMDDGESAPATVVQKPAQPKAKAVTAAATKKPNVQANKENKNNAANKETANKKAAPKQDAQAVTNKGNRPATTTGTTNANERSGTGQERRNVSFKPDNEVREQRNNRRNLRNDDYGNGGQQQRPFRENRENRENRGNFRNREGNFRGKREFDRQSGSDKTGVKAVDKRDGAGAHNWGSVKQEIENVDITATDADATLTDKDENEVNETGDNAAAPEEETVKEMTLDEYKALREQREKPKYNIRKPGEGEDTAQWKKMIVLNKKKEAGSEEEFEFDPSMYPQRVGRLQRIVDIQFNFKDGRRGGGNFGRRGDRGDRGGERGDRGGDRGDRGGDRGDRGGDRGDRGGDRGDRGGPRGDKGRFERGERNENAGGRNDSGKQRNFGDRQQKSGIKIDYESQFPTLG